MYRAILPTSLSLLLFSVLFQVPLSFLSYAIGSDPSLLETALEKAGENRSELEKAIEQSPPGERAGMVFLIENMPDRDLTTLSADFLLENNRLAYQAVSESKWGEQIPEEIFFDAVLPYANINERRDRWRQEFYDRFRKTVEGAESISEAAALLNQQVFPTLNVKYSTGRKKADQSPFESMESGLASCTGLSVILVDACRAVGIPARIVGTPLWSDRSGNHTWVEIWDNGWHFTGACEPTGNNLNQGWFTERASRAQRDDRLHAIYAVTFRRNGQSFPMVWAREVHDVYAVNVTDRYTALNASVPEGHGVIRVRVRDDEGKRVSMAVVVRNAAQEVIVDGESKDERFDSNDHFQFTSPMGTTVTITVGDNAISREVTITEAEAIVDLALAPSSGK